MNMDGWMGMLYARQECFCFVDPAGIWKMLKLFWLYLAKYTYASSVSSSLAIWRTAWTLPKQLQKPHGAPWPDGAWIKRPKLGSRQAHNRLCFQDKRSVTSLFTLWGTRFLWVLTVHSTKTKMRNGKACVSVCVLCRHPKCMCVLLCVVCAS